MSIEIVRDLHPVDQARVEALLDEYSPLLRVMPHVRTRQLARAFALIRSENVSYSDRRLITYAEQETVRLYVHEDFCGLCGRYTDHVGEH